VLRDANQNISINRLSQTSQTITASGGTTTLTAASAFSQILNGAGGQTFKLPDATTLTNTTTFEFNNNATGTLSITDNTGAAVGNVASGGAAAIALLSNGSVGGTWDVHAYIPESVTWGTNSLSLGSTVISGGTWQGGTIQSGYGGTGLTTFSAANNALYSTSASALAAGTLPVAAGGTGTTVTPTNGQLLVGNGTNYTVATLGTGTGISTTTGAGTLTINNTGVTSLAGTSPVNASASTGSVTVSLATAYGDTQNPYASKTNNYFLAAPNGSSGAPTFRAVVADDIPTLNQNTSGTASNVTGIVAIANGGSGASTAQTAMNAFAGAVTSGSYLRGNGTNVVMSTIQAADVPTLNQNTTGNAANVTGTVAVANGGTGLTSGTSGGVLYYSASGTLASSAALAASAIVLGGGAGTAPATTTTGTGVVTALGNNANATGGFTTINGTATLTNKRIDPRVSSTTSTASITPDISSFDQYAVTAQAATLTINAPTGTPVDGNKLIFRILDDGTTRTLSWNATYTVIGVTLPTSTTATKMTYVGCIYNAANTRWDVVAVTTQA